MACGVVVEGGVGALGVVVFDVSGYRRSSGGEVVKAVLPGAFLFECADEALAQPILLGRVGRDVFPREAVVAHEGAVGPPAEAKAVVVAQGESYWNASGGAEAVPQGLLQRTLGSLGTGGVSQFPAEDLTRAAINNRHKGTPAIVTSAHGGDVVAQRWLGDAAMDLRCSTRGWQCRRMMRWTFLWLMIMPK